MNDTGTEFDKPYLPARIARSLPVRLASAMYGGAVDLRNTVYNRLPFLSHDAGRPVISIGGIRAGGTGKTPVALLVGRHLLSKGYAVAFLSRGYRRKDRRLSIVEPHETVAWEQVGDEPCLLHNALPQSWLGIGGNRYSAAKRLARILPHRAVFVLDDGFQHRALRRDMDIICLHDSPWNDRLLPSGNLRESAKALSRAQVVLYIGPNDTGGKFITLHAQLARSFQHLSVFALRQEMGPWVNAADGRRAARPPLENPLLVCGIARPERFIAMVRTIGIIPCAERIFPDHHRYLRNDFIETHELYSKGIITTEKDAIRLKKSGIVPDHVIWYLSIELHFSDKEDEKRFTTLIDKQIS